MAQMILVTSGRGGAGKSAVCAYLGAALAACGKTVLIVEASRRSLDVFLGVQDRVVFDLADALAHRCELGEAAIACENGVRLICGPVAGDAPKLGEWACAQLRSALDGHFDFILAEMDGSDPALAALAACDRLCGGSRLRARQPLCIGRPGRRGDAGYPAVHQYAYARICARASGAGSGLDDRQCLCTANRGRSV